MKYSNEHEIRRGADICIQALSDKGYSAFLLGDSLREYSIKIALVAEQPLGNIIVYYSPKKKKYSLVTSELSFPGVADKISDICLPLLNSVLSFEPPQIEEPTQITRIPELYVDGSYRNGQTAYAFALVQENQVTHSANGLMKAEDVNGTHQIAGELEAIIQGLEWCKKHQIREVRICHDLINSQKWATGEFKANNPVTRKYVKYIQQTPVHIRWKKVLAHSGVHFNELVDRLASEAFSKGEKSAS
jgi:ribonuclease HI